MFKDREDRARIAAIERVLPIARRARNSSEEDYRASLPAAGIALDLDEEQILPHHFPRR